MRNSFFTLLDDTQNCSERKKEVEKYADPDIKYATIYFLMKMSMHYEGQLNEDTQPSTSLPDFKNKCIYPQKTNKKQKSTDFVF